MWTRFLSAALIVMPALVAAQVELPAPRPEAPAEAAEMLIEHGVICSLIPEGREAAPDTESGLINLVPQDRTFDVLTDVVPAEMGLSFGVRIVLPEDAAPIDARVVVRHPVFHPSGVTVQRWDAWLDPDTPALNLFSFELPHELVTGEWVFQFRAGGTIFAERRFRVVPPDAAPGVLSVCDPAAPIA
ncbi:DUF3859 domain-containing protein [Cognatishimia sp. F0-27]|uniref:DUF3859 domain-containing protein n=1 Tax=Cognatishimia sp. F0-27 TaxID=2816855 RepID=UPI001D0C5FE2|nr:DUF3859 domain-containing protein [Cognatishimia sp. F0-27]MCC1491123.1 DUF3859 domain-containing protein [Cognatishimia sp. F0-27]